MATDRCRSRRRPPGDSSGAPRPRSLIIEHMFGTMAAVTVGLMQQRSFDDLGTPLHAVTFCVVDLETTGGSPATCRITEVGALKVRGGECLGTLQTLVNPGVPI